MKVLLIGSGGREHAIAWKLKQSPRLSRLFVAPGNGGTADIAENVTLDIADHEVVVAFCCAQRIDLVIIGPEAPLVAGLADTLRLSKIDVFGPSKAAAKLEGSKLFTKQLCVQKGIPTATHAYFDRLADAQKHVEKTGVPVVIKADGLAAGKGVSVARDMESASDALKQIFDGSTPGSGAGVVIEEFLSGTEVSVFAICNGTDFTLFGDARDHKRAFDQDKGPNTGGMGAVSPSGLLDENLTRQISDRIIAPTLKGMEARGEPFRGVLYAGLMLTEEGPKLIEYNVRFGDPECQALMMRLEDDLLEILLASAKSEPAKSPIRFKNAHAVCVVLASKGYPGQVETGIPIEGIPEQTLPGTEIFHAGTKWQNEKLVSNGGRVLNVCAMAASGKEARARAYNILDDIDWRDGFCRSDIGRSQQREKLK